jgi:hypothetical protein
VQKKEQDRPLTRVSDDGPLGYLLDTARFEHLWRVATAFSKSHLVPEHFRGKPEDCFIGCQLALRLKTDPFMLMQHLYVVHGRPGLDAQISIALLNGSGLIRDTIRYRFDGQGGEYGCTALVVDASTGESIEGPKVTRKMVSAEGWDKDKGTQRSKWTTMPELMFRYRAASYLIRAHYPQVTMGIATREELQDAVIDVESRLAQPSAEGGSKADMIARQMKSTVSKAEQLAMEMERRKQDAIEPVDDPSPEEPVYDHDAQQPEAEADHAGPNSIVDEWQAMVDSCGDAGELARLREHLAGAGLSDDATATVIAMIDGKAKQFRGVRSNRKSEHLPGIE